MIYQRQAKRMRRLLPPCGYVCKCMQHDRIRWVIPYNRLVPAWSKFSAPTPTSPAASFRHPTFDTRYDKMSQSNKPCIMLWRTILSRSGIQLCSQPGDKLGWATVISAGTSIWNTRANAPFHSPPNDLRAMNTATLHCCYRDFTTCETGA